MATESNIFQSIAVIQESSFGSLSATTNLPDPAIFDGSQAYIPIQIGQLSTPGDPVMNEDTAVRSGDFNRPADMVTVVDSEGLKVNNRTGQVSFLVDAVQGQGSVDADDYWLGWCLGASLTDSGYSTIRGESVSGTASVIDVDDQSDYEIGQVIQVQRVGTKVEYAMIVDKTNDVQDTITITPQLSGVLVDAELALCRTFGPKNHSTVGSSVAFQIDGAGYRNRAFGCRWSQVVLSGNNARAQIQFTFEAACILDYNNEAPVIAGSNYSNEPDYTDAHVCHFRNSCVVISNAIDINDGDYPVIDGRTELDVKDVTITIDATVTPCASPSSILGMSDMIVGPRTATVTMTLCDPDSVRGVIGSSLKNKSHHNLSIGFGPGGAGQGIAFLMPAAFLETDPNKREPGAATTETNLTWKNGGWFGDQSTTGVGGTSFRLAYPGGSI